MPRLHPFPSTRSTTGARARARARLSAWGSCTDTDERVAAPYALLTFKTFSLGRGEAMTAESMCTICRLSARCLPLANYRPKFCCVSAKSRWISPSKL
eukprot:scaffold102156_cov43-Phaeocystis_antarctica.AAC.1